MTRANRRNIFASLALFASITTSANAAQLSLRYAGGETEPDIGLVGPGIRVEVVWTTTDADDASNGLAGLSFSLTAAPEDPAAGTQGTLALDGDLYIDDFSTDLPGWSVEDNSGILGAITFEAAATPFTQSVFGVGETVIGSFKMHPNNPHFGLHQFYIQRGPSAFTPYLGDSLGLSYSFHPDGDGYNRHYNIGAGFAGYDDGSGAQPMVVWTTPEPGTLAILAFAVAIAGRRR